MSAIIRRDVSILEAEVIPDAALPVRLRRSTSERDLEVEYEDLTDDAPQPSRVLRGWLSGLAVAGALAAYPAMMAAASNIGDGASSVDVDLEQWTVLWAGAAVGMLEHQNEDMGWASDAASWSPMSLLTAKPAYQSALADAVGDFLILKAGPEGSGGSARGDLAAAARLVDASSSGVQIRAAGDALRSYDRRLKRLGGAAPDSPAETALALDLVGRWADRSMVELARSTDTADGNPLDRDAIESVYAAKARSLAAYGFLSTLDAPQNGEVRAARAAALDAWRAAAEFHPLFVLNAPAESTLLGNHPTAMGFLVDRAEAATRAFAIAIESADLATIG